MTHKLNFVWFLILMHTDTRFILVFYPHFSCYILIMKSLEYSMNFFEICQKKGLWISWSCWTNVSSLLLNWCSRIPSMILQGVNGQLKLLEKKMWPRKEVATLAEIKLWVKVLFPNVSFVLCATCLNKFKASDIAKDQVTSLVRLKNIILGDLCRWLV